MGGYVFTQTPTRSQYYDATVNHVDENYEVWIGSDRSFPGQGGTCFSARPTRPPGTSSEFVIADVVVSVCVEREYVEHSGGQRAVHWEAFVVLATTTTVQAQPGTTRDDCQGSAACYDHDSPSSAWRNHDCPSST
jgi:hypothetical protein